MQRFKDKSGLFFCQMVVVVFLIAGAFRLVWRFNHPEAWIPGSIFDPRLVLAGFVVMVLFFACLAWLSNVWERKRRREMELRAAERAKARAKSLSLSKQRYREMSEAIARGDLELFKQIVDKIYRKEHLTYTKLGGGARNSKP